MMLVANLFLFLLTLKTDLGQKELIDWRSDIEFFALPVAFNSKVILK